VLRVRLCKIIMDQSKRLEKVQEWLKNEIGMSDNEIFFEVNDTTLKYLEAKMQFCHEEARQKTLQKKAMEKEIQEVKFKNSAIANHLKQMKMSCDDLSPQCKTYINVIVNVAVELGMLNPSEPSLLIGISKLCSDLYRSNIRKEDSSKLLESLNSKLQDIKRLTESVNTAYDALEKNMVVERVAYEKRLKNQKRLMLKTPEYQKTVSDIKQSLKTKGFSNDIRQETLMKIYQSLEEVDACIRPLQLEVAKFSNLPHDLEESRLQLTDAKMKLEDTEKKLSHIFSNMSLNDGACEEAD